MKTFAFALCIALLVETPPAGAQYSSTDLYYRCGALAQQQTGYDPANPQPAKQGGALKGAAVGAGGGALIGGMGGGDSGRGAAIGAAFGGVLGASRRQKAEQKQASSQQQYQAIFNQCMQSGRPLS
ncbi:MAG: hypothetical protein JO140_02900 [Candidatus Eremiobacteraeota bacterium]|nr:hypothetical protein [Candidatus Eremiobacteraeota bacterium]